MPMKRPTRSAPKPRVGATAGASTDGTAREKLPSDWTDSVVTSVSQGRRPLAASGIRADTSLGATHAAAANAAAHVTGILRGARLELLLEGVEPLVDTHQLHDRAPAVHQELERVFHAVEGPHDLLHHAEG